MLRRSVNILLTYGIPHRRLGCAYMATTPTEKWDLLAGVLVERLPIITKSLTAMENQYQEHLKQIEFEQSLKSDFEMREEKDKLIADLQQRGKMEVDMDVAVQQTAQDLKDAWKDELSQFQLSERTTDADRSNDTKSLRRKLEETLILLVEQSIGKDKLFLLPQGLRKEGETMRQAAERVLQQQCGNNISVQFYGNAPCGFYKYKYPLTERNNAIGAKVFFFRAVYKSGSITQKSTKYEWLDAIEAGSKLKGSYSSGIAQFLL